MLESIHKGARAQFCKRQSAGEYDIDLTYCDGAKAAVEVTCSTDEESQRTLANLAKKNCVSASLCRKSWLVFPLPNARMKIVAQKVDRYLSVIEAGGIAEFYGEHDRRISSVSRILQDLRIIEGRVLEMPAPARIWIGGPSEGMGSIVKAQDLQRAVEVEANEPDNKLKLAKSHCSQRHLFVYVDQINEDAWQAMLWRSIPEEPATLPDEVTHVWAVTEIPDGIIVWFAESGKRWRDLGVIPGFVVA